jgi:Domain of unknown function (DUF4167)
MKSESSQHPPRGRYNGNQPQPQRTLQRNHTFDSNGPNVRIRGGAHQIFERYIALAREAAIGGDPVATENFYQHAEHYFRLWGANRESAQQGIAPPPTGPTDDATDGSEQELDESDARSLQPGWKNDRPGFT